MDFTFNVATQLVESPTAAKPDKRYTPRYTKRNFTLVEHTEIVPSKRVCIRKPKKVKPQSRRLSKRANSSSYASPLPPRTPINRRTDNRVTVQAVDPRRFRPHTVVQPIRLGQGNTWVQNPSTSTDPRPVQWSDSGQYMEPEQQPQLPGGVQQSQLPGADPTRVVLTQHAVEHRDPNDSSPSPTPSPEPLSDEDHTGALSASSLSGRTPRCFASASRM